MTKEQEHSRAMLCKKNNWCFISKEPLEKDAIEAFHGTLGNILINKGYDYTTNS
jgi:hypothetical protein